jgi:23S rRNA (pseudouridine1915-N3)-methyltransferase
MRIEILHMGEDKTILDFFKDAAVEYMKRLSRYVQIQFKIELEEIEKVSSVNDQTLTILVNRHGESLASDALASLFESAAVSGKSRLIFIISDKPLPTDRTLALSKMQIDPSLQMVLLLEQIYRAYRIINNEPYHK